jgi:general secretion pathway protein B
MSYILDALRRADAERERGSVPGIHAQPLPLAAADDEADRAATPWLWIAVGVAVVLGGLLVWQMTASDTPPPAPVAVMPAPAPLPAPVPTPMPAPPPPPVALAPAIPAPQPLPVPRQAAPPAVARAPAKLDTPASAATAAARIYQQSELPDDIRAALPSLAIGGSIYSENPANRMLIVNGQLFHEGDKLAPDLFVEQIKLKAAVLRYKGYRYQTSY